MNHIHFYLVSYVHIFILYLLYMYLYYISYVHIFILYILCTYIYIISYVHIFIFIFCTYYILCILYTYLLLSFGKCQSKNEGSSQLQTLAVSNFDLPGDPKFPLNAFYEKPSGRGDAGRYAGLHPGDMHDNDTR